MPPRTRSATGRRLVIVESPTKARKIAGYLGDGYDVEASVGHIRDLPTPSELPADMKKGPFGKFAVDVDNGFEPYYVVDSDKKKKVSELKALLKDADELFLATDEDREGEAIAWHLLQVLKPRVPVRRMVFHEITPEAIRRAVDNTRELDQHLVDAQETRRILDRLYGYEISPVLWRKVRAGLSAGRVQSVATRLVVERERERIAFRTASYWDIEAEVSREQQPFTARLAAVDGARVASGRDFGSDGRLVARSASAGVVQLDEETVTELAAALEGRPFAVRSVEEKPYSRRPAAPFITSTLQQEASRKLRWSSQTTMRVAQRLYENGYITYMRTDSTTLSQSALDAARSQARALYGPEYVPDVPRRYEKKVKNAQEAHEAVRPAGDVFRTPGEVSGELARDEFALYDLIWKRTVASQMADARGTTVSVRLGATAADGRDAEFSSSGTVITFRGFLAAYEEGRDEDASGDRGEQRLPQVRQGDALDLLRLTPEGHQTSPPARYTEATLVKALEERAIGRPSTYASILGTILDRGYVFKKGSALVPTWLAFAVTRLLEEHFGGLVDYDFTAEMEEDLDRIAGGNADRRDWLRQFYFGGGSGSATAVGGGGGAGTPGLAGDELGGLKRIVENLGDIDAREVNTYELGDGVVVRVGRYGPYIERGEQRASLPEDLAPDELTIAKAEELLSAPSGDRSLGTDPETGREVLAKAGRFGPYVTEVLPEGSPKSAKPRTASLFKTMSLDTVTLDDALRLLTLPRVVGVDPSDGAEITAQNGRYGPYLKKGTDSRTIESEEQLLTISLEEALKVYAQPKQRGRGAARPPLKELGPDPVSGAPMVVKEGRFGAYVTDGEYNATLRRGDTVEGLTAERAAELLAEKRAAGPATKKTAKKAPAGTAKKAPAKRAAAKKAPAGR
ncbi:DNA topoisomerase I [Motilibacter rhizosphaerae]|uniref:DNA topoisomerase 1 n=1 Tax=Motilibacter rhizosphaerae TaxID=598652 RepID=A0A4Q7NAC0_9ACTN|nr:type I DNA topoisomerase [Motilibacter rhizosphaerae]RZS79401.1 DNA topoisomerase I [Motilibacter rhizosphaerae]